MFFSQLPKVFKLHKLLDEEVKALFQISSNPRVKPFIHLINLKLAINFCELVWLKIILQLKLQMHYGYDDCWNAIALNDLAFANSIKIIIKNKSIYLVYLCLHRMLLALTTSLYNLRVLYLHLLKIYLLLVMSNLLRVINY